MDQDIEKLIREAKRIANKRELTKHASCGQVACALLTKDGNIYSGISSEINCSIGACAEYAAIIEMLKNNETQIDKLVACSAKGIIYSPCGKCRELIRMIDDRNWETMIILEDNRQCKLIDLLPETIMPEK